MFPGMEGMGGGRMAALGRLIKEGGEGQFEAPSPESDLEAPVDGGAPDLVSVVSQLEEVAKGLDGEQKSKVEEALGILREASQSKPQGVPGMDEEDAEAYGEQPPV